MAEDLPSALDRVIEGEEDRSGGEYIASEPVEMTENKLSSKQTSNETPNLEDTLSSASGKSLANEHRANEEKPAITKLKENGGELTGNGSKTFVSFSRCLEQKVSNVLSSALEEAPEEVKEEKMDEEKEEEEEDEEDNSAMKDSAQEGMVSSLQAVEEVLGAGDTLSSAFAEILAGDEQDEDENPEEIELDTGISLAVVNDGDTDDDGDDHKQSCCRTCLIVLAALFVLPIVNVFSSVLSFAINGIDTGPTGTMAGPTTWNPASCERHREHPYCLEYRQKWGLQSTTTPSEDFCRDNPGREGCNAQAGRKKRSRSMCDVYVWMPPCVQIKEAIDEMKTPDSTEPMEAQSVSSFLNSLPTTDKSVIRHKQGSQSQVRSLKDSTVLRTKETSPVFFSTENVLKENSFPASKDKQRLDLPVSSKGTSTVPSPPQPPTEPVHNQLRYMFSMSSKDKIPQPSANKHLSAVTPNEKREMLPRLSRSRDKVDTTTCFQTASHISSRTKTMGEIRDEMTNERGDGDKGARILLKLLCTALSNVLQHDTKLDSSLWSISKLSQVAMDKASLQQETRDILPQIFDKKAKDDQAFAVTEKETKPPLPSVFLNKTGGNFVLVSILGEGNNQQVLNNSKTSNSAETLHTVHAKKVLPQGKIWTSVVTGERETTVPMPTYQKTQARTIYSWLPVRLREEFPELSVMFGAERTTTPRHSGVQRVKRFAPYGGDMPLLATADDPQHKAVEDTYGVIYGLFGVISGIMITVLNYKVTTVIGSCVSGLACLAASFLPPTNPSLMVFVLGVMPGIGNNLLVTSVLVALMEYFRKRPLTVLSVQDASGHLSNIAFFFVEALLFPEIGIQRTDWRGLLQYQAATYIICVGAAIVLALLSLHVRGSPRERVQDSPEQSLRARILNISGLSMLKSPVFYALAAIFFFSSLGGSNLPQEYIDRASNQFFLLAKFLVVFMAAGAFVGSLISSCLSRKPPPLMVSVIVIAVLGGVMGVLTLTVEVVREVFDYAIAYSVLFGVFSGLRKPLMNNIIPLTLGMDHLGLAVGLTSFSSGLGSIIGKESAEAIVKEYKRVDAVFYLSGLADLVSVCPCVLLLFLLSKRTRKTAVSPLSEEDRAGPQERVNDQGTALGETEHQNYAVFTVSTGDH